MLFAPGTAEDNAIKGPKLYKAGTLTYTKAALAILFLWLFWGDFCFVVMECAIGGLMQLKFLALGAHNTVIGLFMATIPGAINMICNPVISFKSDRYRSRWGRRIPFIIFTMPFLVACLYGLGFGDQMGFWLQHHIAALGSRFSPEAVAVVVVGVLFALFSFFNTFVNSVFWYLFNDVVPEVLLARFMSWFRLISIGSAALYSAFIFSHAETHLTEIFLGIGTLYLFGFGLMCLKIKEGEYPPPPENIGGKVGVIPAIKTYAKECFSIPHYWYMFLVSMGVSAAGSTGLFGLFFVKSLGLSMAMIATLGVAYQLSSGIVMPLTGWLADRYHPIRVVLWGLVAQLLIEPIGLIWLFWHPAPKVIFYVMGAMSVCLRAPITSLVWVMDPPLFMRVFPRERYGQFGSANAMCRSFASMIGGLLVGVYLDVLTRHFGAKTAYCLLPLWSIIFYAGTLFCMFKFYRSWKQHGGDSAYVAPLPSGSVEAFPIPSLAQEV